MGPQSPHIVREDVRTERPPRAPCWYFSEVDAEIRGITKNAASLDDVARKLATERGEVSLTHLQEIAQQVAGKPLQSLQRARLTKPVAEPGP